MFESKIAGGSLEKAQQLYDTERYTLKDQRSAVSKEENTFHRQWECEWVGGNLEKAEKAEKALSAESVDLWILQWLPS